jgi:hypothetical protein
MCDTHDQHKQSLVLNVVQDSILANANPPSILIASQLHATGRPGIVGQRVHGSHDSPLNYHRQPLEGLVSRCCEFYCIAGH